jgi:hypothetical protein
MASQTGRPQSVTWLLAIVLTFTGSHLLGGISAIQQWSRLNQLPLSVSPLYLTLRGFGWALIGAWLAWGLLRAKSWAPSRLRLATFGFAAFYWLERWQLQANTLANTNRVFALGATLLAVSVIVRITSRDRVLAYFGDHDE